MKTQKGLKQAWMIIKNPKFLQQVNIVQGSYDWVLLDNLDFCELTYKIIV